MRKSAIIILKYISKIKDVEKLRTIKDAIDVAENLEDIKELI